MAACVALAVGAHAALLMQRSSGAERPSSAASGAVSVRMQADKRPADEPQAVANHLSRPTQPNAPVAPETAAATDPAGEEAAPTFEGGVPAIGFPDAPLPEGGAEVRAYLVLDASGMSQAVSTAAAPQLPGGFQKLTEAALRQARLQPGHAAAYCLLARFEPDASQARLAWLPGAAKDAGRCLAGALPAPREIIAAEPAP